MSGERKGRRARSNPSEHPATPEQDTPTPAPAKTPKTAKAKATGKSSRAKTKRRAPAPGKAKRSRTKTPKTTKRSKTPPKPPLGSRANPIIEGDVELVIEEAPKVSTGPNGRGRPRKVVDPDVVAGLAEIHCTLEEMSHVTGVSEDTLERHFADVIARARAGARASLRRKNFQVALGQPAQPARPPNPETGEPARPASPAVSPSERMLIFLSGNILGMREFQRAEFTGEGGDPIQIESRVRDMTAAERLERVVELMSMAARRPRPGME